MTQTDAPRVLRLTEAPDARSREADRGPGRAQAWARARLRTARGVLTSIPSPSWSRSSHTRGLVSALVAALLLGAALAAVFADVVTGGRTLTTSGVELGITGSPPHYGASEESAQASPFILDRLASGVISEPAARHAHDLLRAGELPLWNDRLALGQPLLASGEPQMVSPLRWPLALDPSPAVWDGFLILRLLLAGLCTFGLARALGLAWTPSLGAGALYALTGYGQLHVNTVHVDAMALLPAVILALERVVRRPTGWRVAIAAAVVAAGVLADNPQAALVLLAFAACWGAHRVVAVGVAQGRALGRALGVLGALTAGVALTAVVLVPFLELSGAAFFPGLATTLHAPGELVGSRHVPPRSLVTQLVPWAYGAPLRTWSGRARVDLGGYLGVMGPFLALLALGGGRRLRQWGALCLVWALIALAKTFGLPLLDGIGTLPVLDVTSFVLYLAPSIALCVALLAGAGLQRAVEGGLPPWEPLLIGGACLVAVERLLDWSTARGDTPAHVLDALTGLPQGLVLAAIVLLAVTWVPRGPRTVGVAAVLLLVAFEAFSLTAPIRGDTAEAALVVPGGAIPRPERADAFATPPALDVALDDPTAFRVIGDSAALYPNTGQAVGLSDVRVHSALTVTRYLRFVQEFLDPRVEQRFTGLAWSPFVTTEELDTRAKQEALNLLGVKYVVQGDGGAPDPVPAVAARARGYRLRSQGVLRVWENPGALDRGFLVHRTVDVPDVAGAVAAMDRVLDAPGEVAAVEGLTRGQRLALRGAREHPGDGVVLRERGANRLVFQVTTTDPGVLVVSDTWYPGWTASVSGRDARVVPADVALKAVYVPAGDHEVVLAFASPTVRVGAGITCAALVALAGFVAGSAGRAAGGLLPGRLVGQRGGSGSSRRPRLRRLTGRARGARAPRSGGRHAAPPVRTQGSGWTVRLPEVRQDRWRADPPD